MVSGRQRNRLPGSRLPDSIQIELIEYFVGGWAARSAAALTGVNRRTAALCFHKLRELIAGRIDAAAPEPPAGGAGVEVDESRFWCHVTPTLTFGGAGVEMDESRFGGVRKGKRGRGARGEVPVFGRLKRGGEVHTAVIPNAQPATLFPIIREKIKPDSVVYSKSFHAYDALDAPAFHHVRVNHSGAFADDWNHITGVETFWNQAKRHLRRFNGVPRQRFHLYLKARERRFNYRPAGNLLKVLCKRVTV